jgi:hypothetical protein
VFIRLLAGSEIISQQLNPLLIIDVKKFSLGMLLVFFTGARALTIYAAHRARVPFTVATVDNDQIRIYDVFVDS